jgi:prevent-host-death family protein
MRVISIRDLHLDTGMWVRRAAETGPVTITDRGRAVATIGPLPARRSAPPLPNRAAFVRRLPRTDESGAIVSELRGDR